MGNSNAKDQVRQQFLDQKGIFDKQINLLHDHAVSKGLLEHERDLDTFLTLYIKSIDLEKVMMPLDK
jgi:hypothetical protein